MSAALDNPARAERFVVVQRTAGGRTVRHGGFRLAQNAIDDANDLAAAWAGDGDLVAVVDLDLVYGDDDGIVWRTVA